MNSDTKLTLAFFDRVPDSAASELQRLPLPESAALLESVVPPRIAAPLLIRMIPWNAARLLEAVHPARAAEILRQMGFVDALSLARLISAELRDGIVAEMPSRLGRRLTSALRYPSYQVGAWVDAEVPTLAADDTVKDGLRVLRSAESASHVFLEAEPHGKYIGAVSTREILRADPSSRLRQLNYDRVEPVSNRAALSSISFDERWDEHIHLPVVGRRGNLLGGLNRRTLRHAIHEHHASSGDESASSMRLLAASYGVVAAGIVQLILRSASTGRERARGSAHE